MKTILLAGLMVCVASLSLRADDAEESRLVGVVQSTASPKEKQDACARLKQIGTPRSVPALAVLLNDEHYYQAACDALETMPFKEAGEALHMALKTSAGKAKAGVIHALGERRHRPAVTDFGKLLTDSDPLIATAAARALGEIGSRDAASRLRKAMKIESIRSAVVDALLRCAVQLAAEGNRTEAIRLFKQLNDIKEKEHIRTAAFAGLVRTAGDRALELIVAAIQGKDTAQQIVALQLARDIQDPGATAAFTDLLPKARPAMQAALLGLLQQRDDPTATPTVLALARHEDAYVRVNAIAALGTLGDASAVPLLAGAAVSRDEDEQKAARQALIALRRGNVGETLVAHVTKADANVQAELARALAGRAEKSAVPSLLELAHSASETTRKAAVRALSLLADGSHLAALVKLINEANTEPTRADIRGVFESIVDRAEGKKSFDVSPLVAGLNAPQPESRIVLLQVSALFADERLRSAFRTALKDADAPVRDDAARAMCASRDAGLLPDLLELARNSKEFNLRVLALEGYVRLVSAESSGFTSEKRAELLKPVSELATRPEEKRVVLSALAAVAHPNALELVEHASGEGVQAEAEIASLQIAKSLLSSAPIVAGKVLQQLATEARSAEMRTNAQATLNQLKPSPPKK